MNFIRVTGTILKTFYTTPQLSRRVENTHGRENEQINLSYGEFFFMCYNLLNLIVIRPQIEI